MPTDSQPVCPHCGQPIRRGEEAVRGGLGHQEVGTREEAGNDQEPSEYDHRGRLLPRRTRMGGIIAPQ